MTPVLVATSPACSPSTSQAGRTSCASSKSRSTDLPGRESEPSHKLYTGSLQGRAAGPVHADPYPNTDSPGEVQPSARPGNEPLQEGQGGRRQPARQRRHNSTEQTQGQFGGHQHHQHDQSYHDGRPRAGPSDQAPPPHPADLQRRSRAWSPAVVILAVCWLVFGGPTPFGAAAQFQLRAVFTVQTQLHLDSPVRVAGVDVGKVTSIKRVGGSSPAAVVTMTDRPPGPARSTPTRPPNIRPRLFLEGNFYVDLSSPARPNAPAHALRRHAARRPHHQARCSSTACSRR